MQLHWLATCTDQIEVFYLVINRYVCLTRNA